MVSSQKQKRAGVSPTRPSPSRRQCTVDGEGRSRQPAAALSAPAFGLLPLLYQLDEDAVGVPWMDKGLAPMPLTAHATERFDALAAHLLRRRIDVLHFDRDVVESGAALLKEAADKAVVAERLDQLEADLRVRQFQFGKGVAFRFDGHSAHFARAEDSRKPAERLIDRMGGKGDVVDARHGQHVE